MEGEARGCPASESLPSAWHPAAALLPALTLLLGVLAFSIAEKVLATSGLTHPVFQPELASALSVRVYSHLLISATTLYLAATAILLAVSILVTWRSILAVEQGRGATFLRVGAVCLMTFFAGLYSYSALPDGVDLRSHGPHPRSLPTLSMAQKGMSGDGNLLLASVLEVPQVTARLPSEFFYYRVLLKAVTDATITFLAIAVIANLLVPHATTSEARRGHLQSAARRLKLLLGLAAFAFILGMLCLAGYYAWLLRWLHWSAGQSLASSDILLHGTLYTLLLSLLYVPSALILTERCRTLPALTASRFALMGWNAAPVTGIVWFKRELGSVLALLAPLLASPLLQKLIEALLSS